MTKKRHRLRMRRKIQDNEKLQESLKDFQVKKMKKLRLRALMYEAELERQYPDRIHEISIAPVQDGTT